MRYLGADNSIPFVCTNCDTNHFDLSCPECATRISRRFIKVEKKESPWGVIIVVAIIFLAFINSGGKSKKQSENIPAIEEPVNDRFGPDEPSTSPSTTAYSPSFDCSRVTSDQENLICGDSELAELDVNLNNAYIAAKNKSADKSLLLNEQRTWVQTVRNACADKECLKESMSRRIEELTN